MPFPLSKQEEKPKFWKLDIGLVVVPATRFDKGLLLSLLLLRLERESESGGLCPGATRCTVRATAARAKDAEAKIDAFTCALIVFTLSPTQSRSSLSLSLARCPSALRLPVGSYSFGGAAWFCGGTMVSKNRESQSKLGHGHGAGGGHRVDGGVVDPAWGDGVEHGGTPSGGDRHPAERPREVPSRAGRGIPRGEGGARDWRNERKENGGSLH